jgi:1,4-dihydroxy-2-naphthoyl-CoA hydrolase
MAIWFDQPTLDEINALGQGTMVEYLQIKFTEIGDDYLVATMPVNQRTKQPLGLLHGGASAALAETLGSVASILCLDQEKYYAVGLVINSNHMHAVREGFVTGYTRPVHLGRTTHVWDIEIFNPEKKLVNVTRLTMAVLNK